MMQTLRKPEAQQSTNQRTATAAADVFEKFLFVEFAWFCSWREQVGITQVEKCLIVHSSPLLWRVEKHTQKNPASAKWGRSAAGVRFIKVQGFPHENISYCPKFAWKFHDQYHERYTDNIHVWVG